MTCSKNHCAILTEYDLFSFPWHLEPTIADHARFPSVRIQLDFPFPILISIEAYPRFHASTKAHKMRAIQNQSRALWERSTLMKQAAALCYGNGACFRAFKNGKGIFFLPRMNISAKAAASGNIRLVYRFVFVAFFAASFPTPGFF